MSFVLVLAFCPSWRQRPGSRVQRCDSWEDAGSDYAGWIVLYVYWAYTYGVLLDWYENCSVSANWIYHFFCSEGTNAHRVALEALHWKADHAHGLLSTACGEESLAARGVERPHTLAKVEVPEDMRCQQLVLVQLLASWVQMTILRKTWQRKRDQSPLCSLINLWRS